MNVGGHNAIQRRQRCDNVLGTTDTTPSHGTFYQQPVGKESVIPPPKEGITPLSRHEQIKVCGKCETGMLFQKDDYLQCIICGWETVYPIRKKKLKERSYHPSVVELDFLGVSAQFARTKMRLKIIEEGMGPQTNLRYRAYCPMCESNVRMLMGNRRRGVDNTGWITQHVCSYNHEVSVFTSQEGVFIGWK